MILENCWSKTQWARFVISMTTWRMMHAFRSHSYDTLLATHCTTFMHSDMHTKVSSSYICMFFRLQFTFCIFDNLVQHFMCLPRYSPILHMNGRVMFCHWFFIFQNLISKMWASRGNCYGYVSLLDPQFSRPFGLVWAVVYLGVGPLGNATLPTPLCVNTRFF